MGDLEANFSSEEFKCQCCGVLKIDIDDGLIKNLQFLRNWVEVPIHINSGYRCPEHNKEVGGSEKSQHLLGKAADIVIQGMTPWRMYDQAMAVGSFLDGGVGVYPDKGFIHVDVRSERVRWLKRGDISRSFDDIIMY